jgi:hypothetical protein
MATLNRRDLGHTKLSLSNMHRNGSADAQFLEQNLGLPEQIRFADMASH